MTLEELKELQEFMSRENAALCRFEYDDSYDRGSYKFTKETEKYEVMIRSLIAAEIERVSCSEIPNKSNNNDELLWQEIFSLREKLKIAVEAIKSYDPEFDDREFAHQLNSVDYDQLMEELAEDNENE